MTKKTIARLLTIGSAIFLCSAAIAQNEEMRADAQADVWATIEAEWDAAAKNNGKWVDEFLADEFVGWGKNSPAPRNKMSTRMWDRFESAQGKSVEHELYPLSIVVSGDVAVAHYLYSNAFEDKDGDVEVSNGRYTDVLVRTDEGWKFLAWHGGDD